MSALTEGLLVGWNRNLDYFRKLLADVPAEKMCLAPKPKMTHPAWIISHLCLYHRPLEALLLGEPFEDPKGHTYGMGSEAVTDPKHYAGKEQLVSAFVTGHDKVAAALRQGGEAALERPMPLERWRGPFPKVGVALPYLMLVHESTHLGQISAWRRVQGMPSV